MQSSTHTRRRTSYGNVSKRHIRESIETSPFPADDHKAARHRQDNMIKTNKTNPQNWYRIGTVSKKITGGIKHVSLYQPHP